ncbi:MAG: hypothetical protein K8R92_08175 [Planctomycetes bacterium]|nr:hypothetical protein [Planctomycetota bacterium]
MSRAIPPTPQALATPKSAQAPRARQAAVTLDPVRLLREHIKGIIIALVGGAFLGVGLHYLFLYTYPLWTGTAYLEIRNQLEDAKALNAKDLASEEAVIRLAQTEVARMISRDNLKKALGSGDVQKTEWSKGTWFRDENGVFNIDEAATDLENSLRAAHRRGTQIFFLGWSTHVPEDVPVVLNAVAETYIKDVRSREDSRFATILRVYEDNRKVLDDKILQKKQEIQDFVRQKGMTSLNEISSENSKTLEKLRDELANTTKELSVAESRLKQAEQKQRGEVGLSDEDLRDADNDPVMVNLNRDHEDMARRYEAAKVQFGETHTELIQLKNAKEAIAKQRDAKRDEIINRNKLADLRSAINRVETVKSLLTMQQEEFVTNSKKSEEFTSNMAELGTLREQLSQVEEQRKLVAQTINDVNLARLRDESHRVEFVQPAIKPREITFPQLKFMIPGTAVLVCGIYIVILFVREIMDKRIKYPSDLAAVPGRILGIIPDVEDDPTNPKRAELVVYEKPQSMTAENFRQCATLVERKLAGNNSRVVVVMSPMPGSGTTTMVLNLSACDASMGLKTLMVGANMRRPGISKALGMDPTAVGLGCILNGTVKPEDTLSELGPNLHFIGAGNPATRAFKLLNTPKMDAFLEWARQRYDRIYLDAPPSVVAGEGLALANKADAAILVARAWQDQKGLVIKLANQLEDSKCLFLGTILNRLKNTAGGYFKKNAEAIAEYASETTAFQQPEIAITTHRMLTNDGTNPPVPS